MDLPCKVAIQDVGAALIPGSYLPLQLASLHLTRLSFTETCDCLRGHEWGKERPFRPPKRETNLHKIFRWSGRAFLGEMRALNISNRLPFSTSLFEISSLSLFFHPSFQYRICSLVISLVSLLIYHRPVYCCSHLSPVRVLLSSPLYRVAEKICRLPCVRLSLGRWLPAVCWACPWRKLQSMGTLLDIFPTHESQC